MYNEIKMTKVKIHKTQLKYTLHFYKWVLEDLSLGVK
jgi:hypothetical protein